MAALQLNFLVEVIAKALCFEHYVAVLGTDDPDDIDVDHALHYFLEREEAYLNKAKALLIMVEHSEELLNETFH